MKEAKKWVDERLREGRTIETSSGGLDPLPSESKNALSEPHEKDEPAQFPNPTETE